MRARIPLILTLLTLFSCTDYAEQRDCSLIDVSVSDTLLVKPETIKSKIVDEYGCCIGTNLDSLDLGMIEAIVDSSAVVKECQAWITRDGTLHVRVDTRVPAVRLCNGPVELFCDRSGYLFPAVDYPLDDVCRITGEIPFAMDAHMHGQPESEKQKCWLQGVMAVADHGFDGEINVIAGGELRLLPSDSKEIYLFGTPDNIESKFEKIDKYVGRIRPVQEYKTVNLKYKGQIICRKDI